MTLYVVHGNNYYDGYGYVENIFGDVILQMKIQQSNSVNLNRTKYPPYTAEEFLEAIEEAHRAFYAKRDNDESC